MTTNQAPLFTLQGSDISIMTSVFGRFLFFPHLYLLKHDYNELTRLLIFDDGTRATNDFGPIPDNVMPNTHAIYRLEGVTWDWFLSPPPGNNTDNYQLASLTYDFIPYPHTDNPITARFYSDRVELTILRIFSPINCCAPIGKNPVGFLPIQTDR
jgi:hypothetical protein